MHACLSPLSRTCGEDKAGAAQLLEAAQALEMLCVGHLDGKRAQVDVLVQWVPVNDGREGAVMSKGIPCVRVLGTGAAAAAAMQAVKP